MAALRWDAEGLWLQLEPLQPGLTVEVLPRCESTNTALVERARHPGFAPTLLVAEEQTRGRGRQGKAWVSGAAGSSLTFTLAVPLALRDWQGLSLAVGTLIADALEPQGSRLGLKWPNDLWLMDAGGGGRKLGGILIESVLAGSQRVAVIGVGLNIRPAPDEHFDTGRACLQELDPAVDAPAALKALVGSLLAGLRRFETEGFAAFAADFARRDLLRGRHVSAPAAGIADGLAEGVDARGALQVRDGATLHALISGEVSVRPLAQARQEPSC